MNQRDTRPEACHCVRAAFGVVVAVAFGVAGIVSSAEGSEVWSFDLTTTGNDVFWTSPTSVDNQAAEYEGTYEITLVEVTGMWGPFPVGPIDVTDEIPKEDLSGTDTVAGPPPIVLLDDSLVFPEPPEEPSFAADVLIYLDADGFGQLEITDVFLGTVVVPTDFGKVEIQITSVRVAGTVEVTPLGPFGDLNGDGVVNVLDLLILLEQWGTCDDPDNCPADLNGDGTVNVLDLLVLLENWG